MPRVTAKSMAEMMSLPGHAQMGLLVGQKYPKKAPSSFQVPYYSPAVTAFRDVYRTGNSKEVLAQALAAAEAQGNEHRRRNLERAIKAFSQTDEAKRRLSSVRVPRLEAALGNVGIKASPDLEAIDEDGDSVVIYYHCGTLAFDVEAAKRLLEIAHWIYEQNGLNLHPWQFEMLDLSSGTLHTVKKIRPATIKDMKTTAKLIESVWEAL